MRLISNRVYVLLVMAALVFASGVAVGQGAGGRWKKYLVRSEATQLDWNFLAMQIQDIQHTLNVLEELNIPGLHGVRVFSINPKTGKIQVLVPVHGSWADKASLKEVEDSLKSTAQDTLFLLKSYMQEIADGDVEIHFTKMDLGRTPPEVVNDFADYKNGELTIRR